MTYVMLMHHLSLNPHFVQRIVGEGVEITALTWACDSLDGSWRTFCAALDGSLAEVQWKAGKLEASSDSGAGAIWSLAAQPAAAVRPGVCVFVHSCACVCARACVCACNYVCLCFRALVFACMFVSVCKSKLKTVVKFLFTPTHVGFAHPLAASCDDGSVRMFHVEGGETGAQYSRTLARLQVCMAHFQRAHTAMHAV
jgi:hypothetical protein